MSQPSLLWFQQPVGNWRSKKRNTEAFPEIAAAAAKKKGVVKEVIVADCVKDLPSEIRKKVMGMGVDESLLDANFDILCTVMHFKLKHVFKTSTQAAEMLQLREQRKARRNELLEIASEGRSKGRQARGKGGKVEQVEVVEKVLKWLDELEGDFAAQREHKEEDEESNNNNNNNNNNSTAKKDTRRDELVELGQRLCTPSDQQSMWRRFKGWERSGSGGFGTVYVTKDTTTKHEVAVKVMPHKNNKDQQTNFAEVYFLSACRHMNVVSFMSAFVLTDEIWVVMEYLPGGTLSDASKNHTFTEEELAFVSRELLNGVKFLHENQLAHRDIKSGNVMMSTAAEVKLIDFGLCRDMRDGPQVHMLGSPYWMPPEMIRRKPHGCKVDIWSSGICLLELMNGKPPNRDNSIKAMFLVGIGEAPGPAQPNKWSSECRRFIEQLLVIEQEERPSAATLLGDPFLRKSATPKAMISMLQKIFASQFVSGGPKGGGAMMLGM